MRKTQTFDAYTARFAGESLINIKRRLAAKLSTRRLRTAVQSPLWFASTSKTMIPRNNNWNGCPLLRLKVVTWCQGVQFGWLGCYCVGHCWFSATCEKTRGLLILAEGFGRSSILTWHRRYLDHEGGSPKSRPFHCTSVGLTLAITPNVGDSGAVFMVVGDCVRAIPFTNK